MKNVIKLIKTINDIKNNSKIIISIIKMLCQLNMVIINSFKESDLFFETFNLNDDFNCNLNIVKMNSIENLCDKSVSTKRIFD